MSNDGTVPLEDDTYAPVGRFAQPRGPIPDLESMDPRVRNDDAEQLEKELVCYAKHAKQEIIKQTQSLNNQVDDIRKFMLDMGLSEYVSGGVEFQFRTTTNPVYSLENVRKLADDNGRKFVNTYRNTHRAVREQIRPTRPGEQTSVTSKLHAADETSSPQSIPVNWETSRLSQLRKLQSQIDQYTANIKRFESEIFGVMKDAGLNTISVNGTTYRCSPSIRVTPSMISQTYGIDFLKKYEQTFVEEDTRFVYKKIEES